MADATSPARWLLSVGCPAFALGCSLTALVLWERKPATELPEIARKAGTEEVAESTGEPVDTTIESAEAADDSTEVGDPQAQIRRLQQLGYLPGTETAPERTGLTKIDPSRSQPGLNLYVSGHGPEAILIDADAKELHTWRCEFADVAAIATDSQPHEKEQSSYFRRAQLFDNGDLLTMFAGAFLFKLDRNSRPLWAVANAAHHDFAIDDDGGRIFVLTREARLDPAVHATKPVLLDFIEVLDREGGLLERHSIYEAFSRSLYAPCLRRAPRFGDVLHTNTLELLDGSLADSNPAFRRGNVLISLRSISTIAVLDLEQDRVVWVMSGMWWAQHQPTVVPGGNLLIFDNRGSTEAFGSSRVLEFDPLTQGVRWMYLGSAESPLHSTLMGSCQRLANGNTLITETDHGRVLEVTANGETVWEFVNPRRALGNNALIANIPELVRLDPDFPTDWLE